MYVCTNISCSLLGADEIYAHVKDVLGGDPDFNVRAFECLGACEIAPMASVNGKYVGPLTKDDVERLRDDVKAGNDVLPDKQLAKRKAASKHWQETQVIDNIDTILFKDIDEPGLNTLDVYAKRGGYEMLKKALKMEPGAVLDEMLASGVRGRGGAGFAMGRKMSFIPKGTMDKYLVCNADESEPGTFKDRELMQKNPHLLIEGIIIGAYCIGACRSFIFIRGEYDYVADILDAAVAEARAAGFLGENVLGSDHTIDLVVHRGAGAYICGEETALLDSLEGKRGNPRLKPPFPAVQGLYQGPTLINNVETLMNVPVILRMGGAEYAKIGTETSTGTKLISISGQIKYPGNYEIVLGTKSRDILFDLAGGPLEGRQFKAWFPGGSSSPVLPLTDEVLDLPYDFDSLAKAGSMLGSGAIIVFDDSTSIVDVAYKTAHFYRHESCGKCSPCREGTNWTEKMLVRIKNGDATPDGPGHHGLGLRADHGQLPVRARRRDGDAGRLDDQALPPRVRGLHRGQARGGRLRRRHPAGQPRRRAPARSRDSPPPRSPPDAAP